MQLSENFKSSCSVHENSSKVYKKFTKILVYKNYRTARNFEILSGFSEIIITIFLYYL